jgi:hypothetical protein
MGSRNSKNKSHVAPNAIIYNLKGKAITKSEDSWYNLGTNRANKTKRTGMEYDDNYKVGGTPEELTAFYDVNHITEGRVCDVSGKNTILYAPNTDDIEKIPINLIDSLCPFNLFGLQTKCRITNVYDGDSIHVCAYIPLKFLYTPKFYQHEYKSERRSSVDETKNMSNTAHSKQVALVKSIKPTSEKIAEGGLYMVFDCRLLGVDAAEKNTAQGVRAAEVMKELYLRTNNIVYVRFGYPDKYGRMLIDVYSNSQYTDYLNDYLIRHPDPVLGVLATGYQGGTKSDYMKNLPTL